MKISFGANEFSSYINNASFDSIFESQNRYKSTWYSIYNSLINEPKTAVSTLRGFDSAGSPYFEFETKSNTFHGFNLHSRISGYDKLNVVDFGVGYEINNDQNRRREIKKKIISSYQIIDSLELRRLRFSFAFSFAYLLFDVIKTNARIDTYSKFESDLNEIFKKYNGFSVNSLDDRNKINDFIIFIQNKKKYECESFSRTIHDLKNYYNLQDSLELTQIWDDLQFELDTGSFDSLINVDIYFANQFKIANYQLDMNMLCLDAYKMKESSLSISAFKSVYGNRTFSAQVSICSNLFQKQYSILPCKPVLNKYIYLNKMNKRSQDSVLPESLNVAVKRCFLKINTFGTASLYELVNEFQRQIDIRLSYVDYISEYRKALLSTLLFKKMKL